MYIGQFVATCHIWVLQTLGQNALFDWFCLTKHILWDFGHLRQCSVNCWNIFGYVRKFSKHLRKQGYIMKTKTKRSRNCASWCDEGWCDVPNRGFTAKDREKVCVLTVPSQWSSEVSDSVRFCVTVQRSLDCVESRKKHIKIFWNWNWLNFHTESKLFNSLKKCKSFRMFDDESQRVWTDRGESMKGYLVYIKPILK